jgi:hypothetical protein
MIYPPLQSPPSFDRTHELCCRVIQALAQDEQPLQSDLEDLLVLQTKLMRQRTFGMSSHFENLCRMLELLLPMAFEQWFHMEEVMAEAA